jgi:16S rRNA processing protein RimM
MPNLKVLNVQCITLYSLIIYSDSFIILPNAARAFNALRATPDGQTRRKKKNKYSNFSKTDKLEVDPFTSLISESEEKNKIFLKEKMVKRNKRVNLSIEEEEELKSEKRERNKREFPDNKQIDPYNPSTYGYVELGTIVGSHGVYGLMKISAVTDFPERLCKPGIRHLKVPNRRSPREIRLLEGRHRNDNEYLIKLENIGDRNEALKLRGSKLYARQEERPEDIGKDEYLVSDLVECEVYLVTGYGEDDYDNDDERYTVNEGKSLGGKFVGVVKGVVLAEEMCAIPGLGQDLLEIVLPRGRNGAPSWRDEYVLVPMVPNIVPTVDIERKLIYVDPPIGLLDLTYVQEDNVRIKGFLPETSSYLKNIS